MPVCEICRKQVSELELLCNYTNENTCREYIQIKYCTDCTDQAMKLRRFLSIYR